MLGNLSYGPLTVFSAKSQVMNLDSVIRGNGYNFNTSQITKKPYKWFIVIVLKNEQNWNIFIRVIALFLLFYMLKFGINRYFLYNISRHKNNFYSLK